MWAVAWLALGMVGAGPPGIAFREVAEEAGVDFRFVDGSRGKHDLVKIMGGGVALIDADGDGRLDLYLCNGGPIGAAVGLDDAPCRLFLNRGDWRFEDVTDEAGAPGPGYAMGAAVGDIDGDGRDDLLVTGWRDQRLYRNLGGGRFADVTERAGLASDRWGTSAALADLDGDGDLDIYVACYVDYDPGRAPYCAAPDGRRDYCGPEDFAAQADRLYRNEGDGTFADVSAEAGVALDDGRGLGVLVADLAGDEQLDIFVANDGTACRLFENRGALRFAEVGAGAGVAVDGRGDAMAGMGVALGDLEGDGRAELAVGNFLGRSTVVFKGLGGGRFVDATAALGVAAPTRGVLGFGLALEDLDGDGRLDLLQANGHVLDRERLGEPFAMRPTLLHNAGGRLVDAAATAGPAFARPVLGRGLAVGDLDGDGRPDAVLAALDGPPLLLRNITPGPPGLVVELIGCPPASPSATGATLRAHHDGRSLVRQVVGGGSYLSASSRRLCLPSEVDRAEVAWPSGRVESFRLSPPSGGVLRLAEGTGERLGSARGERGSDR